MHTRCCLVLRGQYSAETLVELIERGEITHASLVPTMLRHLLDARRDAPVPSTLRCLLVGGAAASERLIEQAVSLGYPVALTYGLTEACSQVATASPDLVVEKPGTVGLPLDGVEVRIPDSGEIWVRGPTVAASFVDEDGWLATGDYGSLDEDGHLWISGRVDERIISGGVNVDPRAVENAIHDISGVAEVVVVGVPDDTWGEVVGALVVSESASLDLQALESAVRKRVSSDEVPRRLALAAELPRNANGKIDRAEVRACLAGTGFL
jgi:O-succinylbenzoic acid--CoA ligase